MNAPMGTLLKQEGSAQDQQLLVEPVRDFAREVLLPADREWDLGRSSVASVLSQLEGMGLLGLMVPLSHGGLGCNMTTYAALLHEVAYASPSTAVTLSVHTMVCHTLARLKDQPQRDRWLSDALVKENLFAFAVSEAEAGSNVSACRTRADRVPGGYRVNGEKMWITNGLSARWFVTLVRLHDGTAMGQFCALMIDGGSEGLRREEITGKMGIRGSETAVISFDNVFVPDDCLLGAVGQGKEICATALGEGRVGIASQASGIAHACLDAMTEYARQREQFGRPIGKFQAIQQMVADSAVELAAARELIFSAAAKIDRGALHLAASSMAKLYASEAANRIAYRAVQVHGGMGYVHECRVEQLYRDARITTIYEGTSEIQRYVIARYFREDDP